MAASTLRFLRREAQQRGIYWADVQAVYAEMRQIERERRERPNEIRAHAWMMHTACRPLSWPFWRHGFLTKFGQRLARGADYTVVPDYDGIAQQIGSFYPEYSDADGTQRLWDFLLSPYDRLPTAEELWRKAIERVAAESKRKPTFDVPF